MSVVVTYQQQILHIWSGSGVVENNFYTLKICRAKLRNLANWPVEFGKIVIPTYNCIK